MCAYQSVQTLLDIYKKQDFTVLVDMEGYAEDMMKLALQD